MPATKNQKVEDQRAAAFTVTDKTAADIRDRRAAAAVAPDLSDEPAAQSPSKKELDADAPVVDLQGGVVTISVGGNTTAISSAEASRLSKELSRAVQAAHPVPVFDIQDPEKDQK